MFVAFGGSRVLAPSYKPLVSRVVAAALLRRPLCSIRVGCARGADAFVVSAVLACSAASRLAIFCVANPTSRSFARAAARGARVVSFAGGQPAIPIAARLALRSRRSVAGCAVVVFFLASAASRGSLGCAAAAVGGGSQVFAFCCGFSGAPAAPPGCSGSWQPACLAGSPCWAWQPAAVQPALF